MIEIRMRGDAARHPASVVLPLLISDLPAFCRWRGRPDWDGSAFGELAGVVDRLVVDSSEWRGLPARATPAGRSSSTASLSPTSPGGGRCRGASRSPARWPGIRRPERLPSRGRAPTRFSSPAGSARGLRREIALSRSDGRGRSQAVRVDGEPVEPAPSRPVAASDLLSAELDVYARDPVYEAAVRAAAAR